MSLLGVGLSYRTAPVAVLERAAVGPADVPKLLHELVRSEHIAEAFVLSTCNRIEIYADVDRFHGSLSEVAAVLARHAGTDLAPHLYVHYEQAVVQHLFRVVAGLDSMVVGEGQILGQVRAAYAAASTEQTVGRALHELAQRALSAGKRVHAETEIDRAAASVVSVAVAHAAELVGSLAGTRAVVVGAGSMGALAGSTLRRAGVTGLAVANRSEGNARRLADSLGGRFVGLDALEQELAAADVAVTCTGSVAPVVPADVVARAVAGRDRPLVILDLALPRDVDPAVAGIDGISYVDLETIRGLAGGTASEQAVAAAEAIVEQETHGYLAWQRAIEVAPTVVALRARAGEVVDAELGRLDARLPGLDPQVRAELARTVRRAVSTLLHGPTVRVKQLAESPGGDVYAEALRTLFGLAPGAVDSVVVPPRGDTT